MNSTLQHLKEKQNVELLTYLFSHFYFNFFCLNNFGISTVVADSQQHIIKDLQQKNGKAILLAV